MQFYDIFNGDADGLCALQQLRLADPRPSVLVTGAKRDISLVERVAAGAGDHLTVLDIALDRNAKPLARLLEAGATCRYFDHHGGSETLAHPALQAFIDTAPDACTSLLVDRYLEGRHRVWAVVAAFGDNLASKARAVAASLALNEQQAGRLQELGECLNYNAYGDDVEDLYYHPADLHATLVRYADPFAFMSGEPIFDVLRNGYADDLYRAGEVAPMMATERCALVVLPDTPWSRRASGPFANQLAQAHPQRAHAVLTALRGGGYRVSVRAPLADPQGADALCRQFAGGGRKAAAGIDDLPVGEIERFAAALRGAYP